MKKLQRLAKIFLLALTGATFCLGGAGISTAKAAPPAPSPILSVSGTGQAEAAPDCASISLGIVTHSPDVAAAQSTNAATAANIRAAVSALGISEADIQTNRFSCYPEYSSDGKNGRRITGYTVNNSIIVTVRDFSLIGKVIDDALASGANEVSGLTFSLKNIKAVRDIAIKKAVADAKEKAETIAAALGKSIAGIQAVSDNSSSPMPRIYGRGMAKMMNALAMDEATPIEAGTINYETTVNIDFILQ